MRSGEASREATVGLTLPNGKPYPLAGRHRLRRAPTSRRAPTPSCSARVFDNPDGTLLDGALVGVSLEQRQPEQVLTVPQQAVQRDQVGAFVMVVGADGKVELRRVAGRAQRPRAARWSPDGLAEGENVIIEGVNKVRPGIVVDAAAATGG